MCDVCRAPEPSDRVGEAMLALYRDRRINPDRADRDRVFLELFDSLTVSEQQAVVDYAERRVRTWGTPEHAEVLAAARARRRSAA